MTALLAAPALFWRGGLIDEEALLFVRNYLDGRTVAQKVFDPWGNDFQQYQARELSYLFDWLDAQWLEALLRRGLVFFAPPSVLLASLLIVLVGWLGSRRAVPDLGPVTTGLVLALYLSSYVFVSTAGTYYRTAKPLLAPAVLALGLWMLPRVAPRSAPSEPVLAGTAGRDFAVALIVGCAMSLLDRQGFFYAATAVALLAAARLFGRRTTPLLAGAAAATAFAVIYDLAIGPWLVEIVNGYRPSFDYQRLSLDGLLQPAPYAKALFLLATGGALLFGDLPALAYLGATAGLAVLAWRWRRSLRPGPGLALVGLLLLSQVVMFAVMVVRHPEVYDSPDHRSWYYPLAFQALLVVLLLALLGRWAPRLGRRQRIAVDVVLCGLVVGNVASWPRERALALAGHWFPRVYHGSAALRRALGEGRTNALLHGKYRNFYFYALELSPALRAQARSEAVEAEGFRRSDLFHGRAFAWASPSAALAIEVPAAGTYRLAGEVWLRPGDSVTFSWRGARLAAAEQPAGVDGPCPFELTVRLPAGRSRLRLQSRRPAREGGRLQGTAFGVFLPLWLEPLATREPSGGRRRPALSSREWPTADRAPRGS